MTFPSVYPELYGYGDRDRRPSPAEYAPGLSFECPCCGTRFATDDSDCRCPECGTCGVEDAEETPNLDNADRRLELVADAARREVAPWRHCQVSREVVIDGDSGLCPLRGRSADFHLVEAA